KPIVNAFGYTEEYWKDDEFEGADNLLESVKESPFYPDGFYLHRSMWVVNNDLVNEHPDVVSAFVMAQEEAINELKELEPGEVSDIVKEYWELDPELGEQIIEDELLFLREWSWATEGDAQSMVETSKFMSEAGLIDDPLSWDEVSENLSEVSDILEKAYEHMDEYPEESEFLDEDTDVRGLPIWEMDQWDMKDN